MPRPLPRAAALVMLVCLLPACAKREAEPAAASPTTPGAEDGSAPPGSRDSASPAEKARAAEDTDLPAMVEVARSLCTRVYGDPTKDPVDAQLFEDCTRSMAVLGRHDPVALRELDECQRAAASPDAFRACRLAFAPTAARTTPAGAPAGEKARDACSLGLALDERGKSSPASDERVGRCVAGLLEIHGEDPPRFELLTDCFLAATSHSGFLSCAFQDEARAEAKATASGAPPGH